MNLSIHELFHSKLFFDWNLIIYKANVIKKLEAVRNTVFRNEIYQSFFDKTHQQATMDIKRNFGPHCNEASSRIYL